MALESARVPALLGALLVSSLLLAVDVGSHPRLGPLDPLTPRLGVDSKENFQRGKKKLLEQRYSLCLYFYFFWSQGLYQGLGAERSPQLVFLFLFFV